MYLRMIYTLLTALVITAMFPNRYILFQNSGTGIDAHLDLVFNHISSKEAGYRSGEDGSRWQIETSSKKSIIHSFSGSGDVEDKVQKWWRPWILITRARQTDTIHPQHNQNQPAIPHQRHLHAHKTWPRQGIKWWRDKKEPWMTNNLCITLHHRFSHATVGFDGIWNYLTGTTTRILAAMFSPVLNGPSPRRHSILLMGNCYIITGS